VSDGTPAGRGSAQQDNPKDWLAGVLPVVRFLANPETEGPLEVYFRVPGNASYYTGVMSALAEDKDRAELARFFRPKEGASEISTWAAEKLAKLDITNSDAAALRMMRHVSGVWSLPPDVKVLLDYVRSTARLASTPSGQIPTGWSELYRGLSEKEADEVTDGTLDLAVAETTTHLGRVALLKLIEGSLRAAGGSGTRVDKVLAYYTNHPDSAPQELEWLAGLLNKNPPAGTASVESLARVFESPRRLRPPGNRSVVNAVVRAARAWQQMRA
jgi:hypothetical protein